MTNPTPPTPCLRCGKQNPAEIHSCTPLEVRAAAVDQQIIERLAKFMGVTVVKRKGRWFKEEDGGGGFREYSPWNVLRDWNTWRQVELKVMEDRKLSFAFFNKMWRGSRVKCHEDSMEDYAFADLPTRCKALLDAIDSLTHP